MDGDEDETEDAAQGVGLISRRSNRRAGEDASRYPGRDGGDRGDSTALRRRLGYHSEDDDDSSDDELPNVDLAALSPMERDEILVESAFRQIQRAQEKGRDDVQLTKEELGALERRRKRMEEEAARKAARRKARSQRISIPLSQLAPTSRKKSSAQDLSSVDDGDQVGYPPMGYFPPPPQTTSRRRSGASTSTSANQDSRGTSPFSYGYTRPTTRQASESSNARTRASRARAPVEDSDEESSSASSSPDETPGPVDPFKYQVAGPRPTRAAAASTARGNPVADSTYVPPARNAPPPPAPRGIMRGRRIVPEDSSEDSSESEESVVEVVQPPARRTRNSAAAVEEDRGRRKDKEEKEKAKKAASPAGKAARGSSTRKKKKR